MLLDLNKKVCIQSKTTVSEGGGCFSETWTPEYIKTNPSYNTTSYNSASVWANVQIPSSKEDYNLSKDQQFNYYEIVMRNRPINKITQRLIYDGKILHIETVSDPITKNRMLVLKCREEVDSWLTLMLVASNKLKET